MEVYFDNSATTKPYNEVIDSMADTMRKYYGNPSSAYSLGLKAELKMNESRDVIAHTINCSRDEIIFTSGGSESNNFLIKGFIKPGKHLITSKIEHPSILNTCRQLESQGVKVTYLNVNNRGEVDLEELDASITKETHIVSIMHTNNEIGSVQNIEYIGKYIKERNSRIKFHVDAVQGYGKYIIDVKKSNIDLLSASGHKIHGPRGIGIAYIRKGFIPLPLICGGGQEKGFRSGTENLSSIVGFANAAKKVYESREENFNKVSKLKNYFMDRLKDIPTVKINSEGDNYSPYVLSVSFVGVKGEVLLHLLEEKHIYVSTGSACSARDNEESHVLKAIGLKKEELDGTIRFSFAEDNSLEEIDYTLDVLIKSLKFLRRVGK
ncbi:cysteine desulfurase family protein [Clostridium kluyveri]|uniref:Cysteine desulfurase NifS n=1 Tax=Clostridium kluyveri TaxID=1534 RepID=A0A1L5F5C5_CLOKL|nr:cysteine desulfurase family protein [Clostridium kluyveri]APM38204.1 cysteine desulfurase NifS [Clostridium kluyveri]UZQ51783.1 cysteine desulfurase [Clostridium kluyveri]